MRLGIWLKLVSLTFSLMLMCPALAGEPCICYMVDGSRVTVTLDQPGSVKLRSAYGQFEVPFSEVDYLSVGMSSRPELARRLQALVQDLGSPDAGVRAAAEEALRAYGSPIRYVLRDYLKKPGQPPQVTKKLDEMFNDQSNWRSFRKDLTFETSIPGFSDSQIYTRTFRCGGVVENDSLPVTTLLGPVDLKLADIAYISSFKFYQRTIATGKIDAQPAPVQIAVELTNGSVIIGTASMSVDLVWQGKTLSIPLQSLPEMRMKDGRVFGIFWNGDRLWMVPKTETIVLDVQGEKITLPLKNIVRIQNDLRRNLVSHWAADFYAEDVVGFVEATYESFPIRREWMWEDGKIGKAYKFDGKNCMTITGYCADQEPSTTLAMWIKPETLVSSLWGRGNGDTNFGDIMMLTTGQLAFGLEGRTYPLETKAAAPVGRWTHIAVVKDLKNRRISWYINGVFDSAHDYAGSYRPRAGNLYLGTCTEPSSVGYAGLIDEVSVWNRPLSAEEVKQVYDMENGGQSFR